MPEHLNFSAMCWQNLMHEWVVFQRSLGRWLFGLMRKHIPSPNTVKAWGLGSMREGSVEKKASSQAPRHRRKLEEIFRKVQLISPTVKMCTAK